jgi:beta-lactamase regulating signal transducer with metallopeptidase domain
MNGPAIADWLNRAFAWTWQTSLQAAVLIALVAAVQALGRKVLPPFFRYGLWMLVVLRLLLPVAPSSPFSIFNLGRLGLARSASATHVTDGVSSAPSPWPAAQPDEPLLQARPLSPSGAAASGPGSERWQTVAAGLWLIGSGVLLVAAVGRQRRLARSVRSKCPLADDRLLALLRRCMTTLGMRREPRLVVTDEVETPAVFGFWRPRLLLPRTALTTLSEEELRLVFLHELVHVRRADVLLNWLLIALQALHWFNPLVWLAWKRLRAEREVWCDAIVLGRLTADEGRLYGNVLLKLHHQFASARLCPGLASVLTQKTDIQRRITMIANFKPTRRLAAALSLALLLGLCCLTFTRAADPPAAPKPAENDQRSDAERAARGIKVLEVEVQKYDRLVKDKEEQLGQLRVELGITDVELAPQGGGVIEPEALRKLESLRIEAQADYKRMDTLYKHLTNLSRAEIRRAITTAVPDPLVVKLFENLQSTEQKLAEAEAFGPDHPDVHRAKRLVTVINKQIEERLDGILAGLKAKTEAEKARLEDLEKEAERYKALGLDRAIRSRPYWQAKRDLETLRLVRERLQLRLMQEKVDAALPPGLRF